MHRKIFYKKKSPQAEESASEEVVPLWSSNSEFDDRWKRRIEMMAECIEIPGRVADFGCGMMWLESMLEPENTYLGIDYLPRSPTSIVLDLNKDGLEEIEAEVAFLSGVLEYVEDVPSCIDKLKSRPFRQIVMSYCTAEKHPDLPTREAHNWLSHESIFKILDLFLPEFVLTRFENINNYNSIFSFIRKDQ